MTSLASTTATSFPGWAQCWRNSSHCRQQPSTNTCDSLFLSPRMRKVMTNRMSISIRRYGAREDYLGRHTDAAFNLDQSRNFVMRAQLDCRDARLPGSGVFDIKTRAAVAIRHDRLNYQVNSEFTRMMTTTSWLLPEACLRLSNPHADWTLREL